MSDHLPAAEVRQRLRDAAAGKFLVRIKPGFDTWNEAHGNVTTLIGDMEVVIFNDAGDFDYVDSATAADGRMADYDSWAEEPQAEDWNNPAAGLNTEEIRRLTAQLEAAR